jgi:hypothetical protein
MIGDRRAVRGKDRFRRRDDRVELSEEFDLGSLLLLDDRLDHDVAVGQFVQRFDYPDACKYVGG